MSLIAERRASTIESLKEIIVFLAALTFTNGLSTFLIDEPSKSLRSVSGIKVEQWACVILLIFGVFRFYHGNWRLLDENYKIDEQIRGLHSGARRNIIWFDFTCVLLVALSFALLSFFINSFSEFVVI